MKIDIPNADNTATQGILKYNTQTDKPASDITASDVIPGMPEDELEISQEANKKSNNMQDKLEEMRNRYKTLSEELERSREMSDGLAESWKVKIRCMQIAMRIMSGHKVPEADSRYLQEKDPELYGKALTMRVEQEDPKEHDRLSEDEENTVAEEGPESKPVDTGTSDTADVQADTAGEAATIEVTA